MTDTPCRDPDCPNPHCQVCNARHTDPTDLTCVYCLGATRRRLLAIPDLAAQIQASNTGYPAASPGISEHTSRNADTPLMGGDKTSLTGPGGDGRNSAGQPWAADNQPSDPPAVAAVLEDWERDWRETLGLAGATNEPTLTNITTFLLDQLGWAAQRHPAFPDFHHEIRQLHQHLEHAAGTTERPIQGFVDCLTCPRVRLVRLWLPSGLDEDWRCPRCKRTYTLAEYWLAVRQQHETHEQEAN
jgi:hypothetical protein